MSGQGPSLEALRRQLAGGVPPGHGDEDSVRRQWWAALACLQEDFLLPLQPTAGLWLASPLPALYEPELLRHLQGWVWAPEELGSLLQPAAPLLPGQVPAPRQAPDKSPAQSTSQSNAGAYDPGRFSRLPLSPGDGTDPLLLVITPRLQIAMALHGPADQRQLLVRTDPASLAAALALLDERLQRSAPAEGGRLRQALQALGSLESDSQLAASFWPRLAERLAAMAPSVTLQPLVHRRGSSDDNRGGASSELALLEALTHEVRTPLATIRTLIRSLLRRQDLTELVRQRLQQIDGECSEQIDRFGLIFHAAELQRQPATPKPQALARTDLAQLLQQLEPLWRHQLQRRGLALQLEIGADLSPVLSDPSRLETMLGGLMDRYSRRLAAGSTLVISLDPAGSRLRLRLGAAGSSGFHPGFESDQGSRQAVGPVLSWNPETGSLQLSRQATASLFHSLGGRLTERSGRGLTVFFPLAPG